MQPTGRLRTDPALSPVEPRDDPTVGTFCLAATAQSGQVGRAMTTEEAPLLWFSPRYITAAGDILGSGS